VRWRAASCGDPGIENVDGLQSASGLSDERCDLVDASGRMQNIEHLPALRHVQQWQPGTPALETWHSDDGALALATDHGTVYQFKARLY